MSHYVDKTRVINSISKIFIMIFFSLHSSLVLSQPTITLNSLFHSPISNDTQTGYLDQIVEIAFARIGYKLNVIHLPSERGLINANRGIDDGELGRAANLHLKYTNLIMVPEKTMDTDIVLFSKKSKNLTANNGWNSVESYSLAIMSGWKLLERKFSELGNRVDIIKTDNPKQSFTLLLKDRVDFFAYAKWSGLGYLKENNIVDVKQHEPPLSKEPTHIYLHKKHKKIVPLLNAAIKAMKQDGTIDALFNKKLQPFLLHNGG